MSNESGWYFAKEGKQIGPMSREELIQQLPGQQGPETLIYGPTTTSWTRARHVASIAARLRGVSAPPPTPGRRVADEIDYEIFGDDMQFVEITLDPDEVVVAEAGAMPCFLLKNMAWHPWTICCPTVSLPCIGWAVDTKYSIFGPQNNSRPPERQSKAVYRGGKAKIHLEERFMSNESGWYFAKEGKQIGPMSREELIQQLPGQQGPETLIYGPTTTSRGADEQCHGQPRCANPPRLVKVEVMTVTATPTLGLGFGRRFILHPEQKGFGVASTTATRLVGTRFSS